MEATARFMRPAGHAAAPLRFAVTEEHRSLALFQRNSSPSPRYGDFATQHDDSVTFIDWTAPAGGARQAYRPDRRPYLHLRQAHPSIRPPTYMNAPSDNADRKRATRPGRVINKFVDHERRVFAGRQLSAVFQFRLKARTFSAVALTAEVDFRFDNQRTSLGGLHLRLDLVNGCGRATLRRPVERREDARRSSSSGSVSLL